MKLAPVFNHMPVTWIVPIGAISLPLESMRSVTLTSPTPPVNVPPLIVNRSLIDNLAFGCRNPPDKVIGPTPTARSFCDRNVPLSIVRPVLLSCIARSLIEVVA